MWLIEYAPHTHCESLAAWFKIYGSASYPLLGEDAQVWASRARRADTDEVLEEEIARGTVEPKEQMQNGARLA
jgi:hypothetical protein